MQKHLMQLVAAFVPLFAASAVASVLEVTVRTWHLAATVGIGRLRDMEFAFQLARRLVGLAGALSREEELQWLSWAHQPHPLWGVADLVRFGSLALGLQLVLMCGLAGLTASCVALARNAIERHRSSLLAFAFVGSLAPGVYLSIDRHAEGWPRVLAVTLVGGVALLLCVRGLLMRLPHSWGGSGRVAIGLIAATVFAALLGWVTAPVRGIDIVPIGSPNVLLVSIDTLRADHVHAYGYGLPTTPSIDRLAREGALFQRAVSPSSWTLPTHVTMLTGLAPVVHGVNQPLGIRLGPEVVTLPEVLWARGYHTAGFVAGGYLSAEYGHIQGFDQYDDYSVPNLCRLERATYRNCSTSAKLFRAVDAHLNAWDVAGRSRPFFVFLHLWDVHNDYLPPPPYDTAFAPGGDLGFTVGMMIDGVIDPASLTAEQRSHMIGLYDGEILYTDAWIGRLLERLEALGVLDETVIVVTADHGEELGDRGRWGHRETLYDENVLVPLVMRLPSRIPPGTVVREQVRLADVVPTILSLLGIRDSELSRDEEKLTVGEARDLTPLLADSPREDLPSIAFGELYGKLEFARTATWKLIRQEGDRMRVELYDLVADPAEANDIAGEHPEVVRELSAQLDAWRRRSELGNHTGSVQPPEAGLDQLRALGYIE